MLLDLNISFPDAGEKEEHGHVPGIHTGNEIDINNRPGVHSGVRNNPEIVGEVGPVYERSVVDQDAPGQNYPDHINIWPSGGFLWILQGYHGLLRVWSGF